ncbi:hypothetical protein ACJ73_10313, partial [Blastomyces percursus]
LHEDNTQLAEANRQLQITCNDIRESTAGLKENISKLEDKLQAYTQGKTEGKSQHTPTEEQLQGTGTYAEAAATPTAVPTTVPKSPLPTRHLKAEKPARILARLPTDHIARRASPIATLQKLRRELTEPLAAAIKGVQNIPTGIAITASSLQGMEALLAKKDEISAILTSAQVEKEERWVTCIVPGLQPEYQDYEGRTQTLTGKQAAEEFTRITGVIPQLCRWNRAQPERPSNALVLAFPPEAAVRLPKTVEIYGHRRPVIIKPPKAQILQCSRCWAFHPERYCNRNPRCRRCSSRDHQEGHPTCHKEDNGDCGCPDRCTNCLGPHAANDLSCPARPVVKNGVVQRHPKTRKNDIRKAQNQAYWTKSKDCFCGGRYSTLDGRQDASPEGSPSSATASSTAPLSTPNPISSSTTSGTACATSPILHLNEEEL